MNARLFGPLEIETDRGCLGPRDLGGVKPRRLLEILLSERGRRVSKARLAARLWGDDAPCHADATIETYVSVLRRLLGDAGAVVTVERGYRIDPGRLPSDLDEFDELAVLGSLAGLQRALELVRGEILQHDPTTPWALSLKERYGPRLAEAAGQAGARALEAGRPQLAVPYLEQAVRRDPQSEQHHCRLMLASYLLGDRTRALRVYERFRRMVSEQGLDPMPEIRELHRRMVRGEPIQGTSSAPRRVLIVESDVSYQWLLVQCAAAAGCVAELVVDFASVAERMVEGAYDAVISGATPPEDLMVTRPLVLVTKPFSPQIVTELIRSGMAGLGPD